MTPTHILLVTPIATTGITESTIALYPSSETLNLTCIDCAGVPGCPPCINNHAEAIQSTEATRDFLTQYAQKNTPDGILISCFCDHPLVGVLEKTTGLPVVGIFDASIGASMRNAGKFGIVTTTNDWQASLDEEVNRLDVGDRFAGVIATGLGVLELESRPEADVLEIIRGCILRLVGKGAKSVILGCSGMAPLKEKIQEVVPGDIVLLDGIDAGLERLCTLIAQKSPPHE